MDPSEPPVREGIRTPTNLPSKAMCLRMPLVPLIILVLAMPFIAAPDVEPPAEPPAEEEQQTATPTAAELSVDEIAESLNLRIEGVIDISATVTFVQVSERDGARMEGELELAAIFPDLVRATWRKPDYLAGVIWIVDTPNNRFTQYLPASGEARTFPLDEALQDETALRLTSPEDLFTLPPQDQFNLTLVDSEWDADEDRSHYVRIRAESDILGHTYYLLVDTHRWLVTEFQSVTGGGVTDFSARATSIRVNQSLEPRDLRRLPPGAIERSFP